MSHINRNASLSFSYSFVTIISLFAIKGLIKLLYKIEYCSYKGLSRSFAKLIN
jgi:hypothetical protein